MLSSNWKLDVALWLVAWIEQFDKFWTNPSIWTGTTPEDIWNGGGTYTWFWTEVETMEIFSSDANDTSAWTGARTVTITWLCDGNYAQMPDITVTLNWTTPVSLWTQTYLRGNRMVVDTAWSLEHNAWTITLRHTTTIANIFAIMSENNNQTAVMCFTVPLWKKVMIAKWVIQMARSWGNIWSTEVTVRHRVFGWVFNAVRDVTITDSHWYSFENNWYMVFNEKEDVKVTVEAVSDNWTRVSAEADWYMIDWTY